MNGIGIAAAEMQHWLERSNHGFCFIGGIAVVYWGTPRSTQDVNLSLWVPLGEETQIAEALLADFRPRIDGAVAFAEQARILLLYASNGILDRQQTQLDRPFIYQRLKDFCDLLENDDPLRLLEKLWSSCFAAAVSKS